MRYEPEEVQAIVANGTAGHTGNFDRSNGFENDEGALPVELFASHQELVAHAEQIMAERVARDIEEHGADTMLDVEFALDRALIAYGVDFSDTPYHLEAAVAEYFGALANIMLDPEHSEIEDAEVVEAIIELTPEEIEEKFTEITERLQHLDDYVAEVLA